MSGEVELPKDAKEKEIVAVITEHLGRKWLVMYCCNHKFKFKGQGVIGRKKMCNTASHAVIIYVDSPTTLLPLYM